MAGKKSVGEEYATPISLYHITCQGTKEAACRENYLGGGGGEKKNLEARVKEHRRPSCTSSEVSRHVFQEDSGHSFDLDNVQSLDSESDLFKRGRGG